MDCEFCKDLSAQEDKLKQIAEDVVKRALAAGADECAVSLGGARGLSVSSRDAEVENIEFNRDNGLDLTVYLHHRRGSASTTDLSSGALQECVNSAVAIASYADEDPCAGICDQDLQCTDFKDLKLVGEVLLDPDKAVSRAVELESLALSDCSAGIRGSDGASFDCTLYTEVTANSHGFCAAHSSSSCYMGLTLLGQSDSGMQRGSGYTVSRSLNGLWSAEKVVREAQEITWGKLDARQVKTGHYKVIFSRGAVISLLGNLVGAISGGAVYRKSSFLCDALNTRIFPEYVSIKEDPWIPGGFGSASYDSEGVRTQPDLIVEQGKLHEYLLNSYSSRKLGMKSNGHAGGVYNWFVEFAPEEKCSFEELLKDAGEGLVVTELMGQGVDMVSGNYSRGASGYYFKNGVREYPVEEITIAGNLRDMFSSLAKCGTDVDERYKIHTGSLLLPDLVVAGTD